MGCGAVSVGDEESSKSLIAGQTWRLDGRAVRGKLLQEARALSSISSSSRLFLRIFTQYSTLLHNPATLRFIFSAYRRSFVFRCRRSLDLDAGLSFSTDYTGSLAIPAAQIITISDHLQLPLITKISSIPFFSRSSGWSGLLSMPDG